MNEPTFFCPFCRCEVEVLTTHALMTRSEAALSELRLGGKRGHMRLHKEARARELRVSRLAKKLEEAKEKLQVTLKYLRTARRASGGSSLKVEQGRDKNTGQNPPLAPMKFE